jgi:hypothetical protein
MFQFGSKEPMMNILIEHLKMKKQKAFSLI